MDYRTIRENARVLGLTLLFALLLVVPASAADDDPVNIDELPMPIPAVPSAVQPLDVNTMPSLSRAQLPQVSGLPSRMSAIGAAAATSDAILSRAEGTLNDTLSGLNSELDASRSLINSIRVRIGAPTSAALIKAQDDSGAYVSYTAYEAATEMSASVHTSVAYLRGLSRLGGVGLNLTFIIIGLGWIAIVNIIDLLLRVSLIILKIIGRIILFLFRLFALILQILYTIAVWIDIITGPLT